MAAQFLQKGIPACAVGEVVPGGSGVFYEVGGTRLPVAKPAEDEMKKIQDNPLPR